MQHLIAITTTNFNLNVVGFNDVSPQKLTPKDYTMTSVFKKIIQQEGKILIRILVRIF